MTWTVTTYLLMCLWALSEHRLKAEHLSTPGMLPLVRTVFGTISANRRWLGSLYG